MIPTTETSDLTPIFMLVLLYKKESIQSKYKRLFLQKMACREHSDCNDPIQMFFLEKCLGKC